MGQGRSITSRRPTRFSAARGLLFFRTPRAALNLSRNQQCDDVVALGCGIA